MIENQSDNIENKDAEVSEQDNTLADQMNEDNESPVNEKEDINAEDLKNTISNNDARLEQLEREHETLKSQYVRIAADFENFRKRQSFNLYLKH